MNVSEQMSQLTGEQYWRVSTSRKLGKALGEIGGMHQHLFVRRRVDDEAVLVKVITKDHSRTRKERNALSLTSQPRDIISPG